jgi:hypothetical protein
MWFKYILFGTTNAHRGDMGTEKGIVDVNVGPRIDENGWQKIITEVNEKVPKGYKVVDIQSFIKQGNFAASIKYSTMSLYSAEDYNNNISNVKKDKYSTPLVLIEQIVPVDSYESKPIRSELTYTLNRIATFLDAN